MYRIGREYEMTQSEYEELMEFFRRKLKQHPETGLSGNRAEGYEMGIQACMSKVNSLYRSTKQKRIFVLVSPGSVSYPYGIKGCSNDRNDAYTAAEKLRLSGEGAVQVIESKIL